MSVSALDTPVSASSTPDTSPLNPKPEAKASRHAPASLNFNSQSAVNVNFNSNGNNAGPVFGDQQRPADRHGHHNHAHHHTPAMKPPSPQLGFWQQLQQLLSQWFGGQRPPTDYSTKNDDQLGQALLKNFKAFTGSSASKTMHRSAIESMAQKPLGNNAAMNENILLAKELLRRPDVLTAFDRAAGTGAVNGWIDKGQLEQLIQDKNPLKYKSDKQVAQELLTHFDQLKGCCAKPELKIDDLKELASRSVPSNSPMRHLVELAKVAVARGELMTQMDNLLSTQNDKSISKRALEVLSSRLK